MQPLMASNHSSHGKVYGGAYGGTTKETLDFHTKPSRKQHNEPNNASFPREREFAGHF